MPAYAGMTGIFCEGFLMRWSQRAKETQTITGDQRVTHTVDNQESSVIIYT
jgi:hypothetical protein